jgi:alpha-beta hydrolase superfamily lysophospholipase
MAPRPPRIAYHTASDGTVLASRHWRPDGAPRGTVVLLHGIVSHGGWYEATGRALADHGYAVHLPDRRGSGLSSAAPSDVSHWSVWRDDILAHLRQCSERPVVLCGISWGAKLAAVAAAAEPQSIAGLGLLNPGIYAYQSPSAVAGTLLKLSRWLPFDGRSIDIPLKDPALFTGSRRWQDYIARDPLKLRQMTVRAVREDLTLTRQAEDAAPLLTMPMLLVLSAKDRITDNAATRAYFSRLASTDKTLLEYPDAAHTLDFEPDPSSFHADLARWIERIFSRASRG